MTTDEHAQVLRRWAKGSYSEEAAVELLIRAFDGRFCQPGNPWIVTDTNTTGYWVAWRMIEDNIGALSGGERRLLQIAASLGGPWPTVLGDVISGNDRAMIMLVLAAIAHASGSHEGTHTEVDQETGYAHFVRLGTLYPWPE